MKKFIYILGGLLFLFLISCDDSGIGPNAQHIAGTITFTDTTLNTAGGYYAVSLYANQSNPFLANPLRSDTLVITRTGNVYSSYYKMTGVPDGSYYIGAIWIRQPSDSALSTPVLGTYGCDTNRTCSSHIRMDYPSSAGTGAINFQCTPDTLKRLY